MIKNYFKLGFRNLAKHRLSSTINILGLALAVGCCLVVFRFFDWSMHMDNFHHKVNNLYVIERITEKNGEQQLWGNSPAPMGPMLKNDFAQVKNMTRLKYAGVVIKQGDNVFREGISYVDDSFYKMFDFPVKWGNKQHFTDLDGIVLTEELSEKLFGKENSVGKNVSMLLSKNGSETIVNFTVKGVFEKRPAEASFYFSALVPYQKMAALGIDKPGDWNQSVDMTFLEVNDEAALAPIQHIISKYLKLYNAANLDDKMVGYNFQPLRSMNFHAYKVNNQNFASSHIIGFLILLFIGVSTLLMVYFNYMNIAIASASTRLKEIGIRKVMGSLRRQIIFQFILENIILCTFAVIIGLLLAEFIFLPAFSTMAHVDLAKNLFNNPRTWIALFILIIVSAFGGAAYPAFYISAFKSINIIKGNSKMGSNNRFRKALLSVQFFLTFLAISCALAVINETKHVKSRPWGYTPADNVVVTLDKTANFNAFKDELKNNNKVLSVSGSVQSLGNYSKQLIINTGGEKQTVQGMNVLPGFATQMGIKITKGRDLSEEFETDKTDAVLVNQTLLKKMHWVTAIGKSIIYENHNYRVVGEVADFHFENFQSPIGPFLIMGCKPQEVNNVYVKTIHSLFSNEHLAIEKAWKNINPNLPFEYYYQDTVFDQYFSGFIQVSQVLGAASIIMMIISISGIFGLALLILGKKMKEISVRKVLGAGMGSIIYLINREFLLAIGFAILLGSPLSWWIMRNLFNQVTPESAVSFLPLIMSLIILLIMTAISVSWHIYKAHTANPTQYLKDE
ncbi:MAG TPA: ABC transporter permease [Mucilaginibacter sp.]|jgi:ABC-type antimicrobial peptide transport system permease subunit